MGSEGEINSRVYVAVGRDVKEGKSLLNWAVKSFDWSNKCLCLLHVHEPTFLNGKPSGSKLRNHLVKASLEFERLKMQKVMSQYLVFLSQMEIQVDNVWTETSNIEEGILQLIIQHRVRWLIMGAKTESFYPRKWSLVFFSRARVIYHEAPPSCHIWFIFKESLLYTRPVDSGSHSTTTMVLFSSEDNSGTTITLDIKENMDINSDNVQCENLTRSVEDPTISSIIQKSGYVSSLLLKVKSPENLPSSSSDTSLDHESEEEISDLCDKLECVTIDAENSKLPAFDIDQSLRRWRAEIDSLEAVFKVHESEEETSDLCDKLERVTIDAENSKPPAFDVDESLRRWRAEIDALEAVFKAEALYEVERSSNNKIDELLKSQLQEISMMKNQQSQCLEKLQLIKYQKPILESQLGEACYSEKELEDKIIQAVNLLITFKETRDALQIECESVIRKINKYRILQTGNSLGMLSIHFFGASFSDILEATQNFNPSQKIGEGRYGSVFKGTLCHAKVAIKMLPSSGSQSDSEFKHEVEVFSRVRHPNLVKLMGACTESRALIYEYIENGSLEDYLSSTKARSLPWQTRIRIAIDICSILLFLHGNPTIGVHGSLKPSKILLDSNFVTKISGFGIRDLISQNEDTFSRNTPEYFENDDFTPESDVYSFGVIVLLLLTQRPVLGVVKEVKCALENGRLDAVLDMSAGEWPNWPAKQLADLALRCCEKDRFDRPNLESEVWQLLEPMREICDSSISASATSSMESRSQKKIPSHFVCPIFQEVMKDPHITADGFTYEGDAIKGWFGSGHKTSPMTNLKLENCDLLPNYALYYAIQEWQQNT